jgi:hypothetical protein
LGHLRQLIPGEVLAPLRRGFLSVLEMTEIEARLTALEKARQP